MRLHARFAPRLVSAVRPDLDGEGPLPIVAIDEDRAPVDLAAVACTKALQARGDEDLRPKAGAIRLANSNGEGSIRGGPAQIENGPAAFPNEGSQERTVRGRPLDARTVHRVGER